MFDFIFKYFLLFPKILITGHWGILVGEIALSIYLINYVVQRNRVRVTLGIVLYYLFVGYLVLLSSLIAGAFLSYVPVHAIFYFVRLALYLSLFLWAIEYYNKINSDEAVLMNVFNWPFAIHFVVSLFIMVAYYSTHSPSVHEILWQYETGIRMIPLAGLVIDSNSFMFLKALTGSANLLSGWALAILILNFNFEKRKNTVRIILIAIIVVLLSVSRGGFLTIAIFLVYVFFREFNFKISLKPLLIGVFFLVLLFIYFLLSQKFPLPNIFERLTNTYDSGTLDSSSQLRLDKYAGLYDAWHQKLRYIVMGFGFDEEIVILNAKETVIDSFFLEVLFCSGMIGIILLLLFYLYSYLKRKRNIWYKSLFEFLLFQSIISWSVTGGDFLAPHATFIFMTFLGFGYASELKKKFATENH